MIVPKKRATVRVDSETTFVIPDTFEKAKFDPGIYKKNISAKSTSLDVTKAVNDSIKKDQEK